MKRFLITFAITFTIFYGVHAQTIDSLLQANKTYTGAHSSEKFYHAIFQLDTNDPRIISKTIRNINNALKDERLKGRLSIELIAFSGGTDAFLKTSEYENEMKKLVEKGVILAQCNNSLLERKIGRDKLYDFIGVVPSGTGELIIRQDEGWSVIKP